MAEPFEGWCILELMGHRRLAGHVRGQEIGGAMFLRIDVPATEKHPAATQFYSPAAVYAITPCTEETARQAAGLNHPEPVSRWELQPALPAGRSGYRADGGEPAEGELPFDR